MSLLFSRMDYKKVQRGGWVLLLAIGSRRGGGELFSFPSFGQ